MSSFFCSICHKDFINNSTFQKHLNRSTPCSEPKIFCEICQKGFKSQRTLSNHQKTKSCGSKKECFTRSEIEHFCLDVLPKLKFLSEDQKERWMDLGLNMPFHNSDFDVLRNDLQNESLKNLDKHIKIMRFLLGKYSQKLDQQENLNSKSDNHTNDQSKNPQIIVSNSTTTNTDNSTNNITNTDNSTNINNIKIELKPFCISRAKTIDLSNEAWLEIFKKEIGSILELLTQTYCNPERPEFRSCYMNNENDDEVVVYLHGKWAVGDDLDDMTQRLFCVTMQFYEDLKNSQVLKDLETDKCLILDRLFTLYDNHDDQKIKKAVRPIRKDFAKALVENYIYLKKNKYFERDSSLTN